MSNYTAYHVHSFYSLLDSCTSPEDYVKKAKELGQTALGFTEHGNIFQWFKKKQLCEKAGLKYIHGIECYVTESLDAHIRDNWHTILIAKNTKGFIEINNLFFKSYQKDHTHYKHRISLDEFLNISENVIKISACIQSPLWQMRKSIEESGNNELRLKKYNRILKHYDYYEIQYHNFSEQIEFNKYLYQMSQKYSKPLIVGTDTHNLNSYKAECRTILQYGKTDGLWGDSENECDLTFKSYDELIVEFKKQNSLPLDVIKTALENTNVMADSIEPLDIDTTNKYPFLYGEKDEEVMWNVLNEKYKQKLSDGIISDSKQYLDNINEEMSVFKKTNMIGFMLFMSEMMTWARTNGIATGSARGSVAGSTVAYISDITDVDPIKWKTIFSRFCNEHRVEIGDIDTDWYEDDRQKVYDYIINRFGYDKTGYVLALGTLADKAVIDVIGKAHRIIAEKNNTTTPYSLSKIKEIKTLYENNPEKAKKDYPDIFYYYDGLVNCVVSQSQHPAGIVASPINLIDFCGAFIGENGQYILPLDMDCCHDIGLVKYDILGLKTVGVIYKTCKLTNKNYPRIHEIDFNDQMVYEDMTNNHLTIFQFESQFAGDCLKRMNCHNIFDLSLVNACIRPSGESYRDKLLSRIPNQNPSQIIDKLLERNYGHLVYQEDTIAFLQNICGFTGSDADNVRRAIGRKKVDELNAALPKILDGYCSKSDQPREIAEQEAKKFLQIIEDASSYQFGYNHSIAYSLMSYLCAYFRHYYPLEYCTSFLNCAKDADDIANGTELAKQYSIKIIGIKFRYSSSDYTIDKATNSIHKGISSIKYMNKKMAEELYQLRDNEYNSFAELLVDIINKTSTNSRQLNVLIKLDFFSEFGQINKLLYISNLFDLLYGKRQLVKKTMDKYDIPTQVLKKFSSHETETMYRYTLENEIKLINYISDNKQYENISMSEIISLQKEYLGYIDYCDPTLEWRYVIVTNLNDRYSPRFDAYSIGKGTSVEMKIHKNRGYMNKNVITSWADLPLKEDNIIYIKDLKREPKRVKVGEKWISSETEFEWWIKDYVLVGDSK